jgi:hypothetical protein
MRIDNRMPAVRSAISPGARPGLSLAEVLISILVLSLGLMGVLALYPLGAKQMADAIKDERCAQLADIEEGMFRIYWRSAYLNPDGSLKTNTQLINGDPTQNYTGFPELGYLDNPFNGKIIPAVAGKKSPPAKLSNLDYPTTSPERSSPLYLDPIGYYSSQGKHKTWVGGIPKVLPRQTLAPINHLPNKKLITASTIRMFSLLDDMTFNPSGVANPVERGYQYNAAWLIQRLKNNQRQEVNLKVVVYHGRPPADTPPIETLLGTPTVSAGTDQVVVTSAIPSIRKGSWILLANQQTNSKTGTGGGTFGTTATSLDAYADFYRVVAYTQSGSTYSLTVSPRIKTLGVPPAGSSNPNADYTGAASSYHYTPNVFLLDSVAEVFDRGTITPFEVPAN